MIGVKLGEQGFERGIDRVVQPGRLIEALGHQTGLPCNVSGIAENAPVDQKRSGLRSGLDQVGYCAVPDVDVEELVGVEHHLPMRFAKDRQFLDAGISGQLCLVPRANLIDQMRDNPQLLETVQQRRRPVDAVIRADNNVGEPGR